MLGHSSLPTAPGLVDTGIVETDRQGLSVLDEETCSELLRSARLGRVALSHRALPLILPVAFGKLDRDVIFSVGPGLLARAADEGQIVCFETDWADPEMLSAWSVSVIGQLSVLVEPCSIRRAQHLDLGPWSAKRGTFVQLSPHLISGRRFAAG